MKDKSQKSSRSVSWSKSFAVTDDEFTTATRTKTKRFVVYCVAVAITKQGVALRDSKDPSKKTLFYTNAEWSCFIEGVKNGEFEPIGGMEAHLP